MAENNIEIQIEKILKDKSLTDEDKEECIRLLVHAQDEAYQEDSDQEIIYDPIILIDKTNKETVFLASEASVFEYLSVKSISIDDVVVYRKQTLRLNFENSD